MKNRVQRTLSDEEEFSLTEYQKNYLRKNTDVISLQSGSMILARHQLYRTPHGAITLDRSMELDALRNKIPLETMEEPPYDSYSNQEDNFIDQHGMSTALW